MSISMNEILMGRAKYAELPKDLQNNLLDLLERINKVRSIYGVPMKVSSGYRSPAINAATKGSGKNSWHMKCAAIDIHDPDCKLWTFVIANLQLMKDIGLWIEDKRWTPTWVHFQIYPPNSKKRIFIPSSAPATNSALWDGHYDVKYD